MPLDRTDFLASFAERERQSSRARFDRDKRAICAAMQQAGLTHLTLTYTGSCDDGCIEGLAGWAPESVPEATLKATLVTYEEFQGRRAKGGGGWEDILVTKTAPLDEAACNCAYAALEALHPGWEINEGSSGQLHFVRDGDAITLTVAHDANVMTTEHSEDTL